MSVDNANVVDGMGIDKKNSKRLILMIADHLDWENETEHLLMLQDKINGYLAFWEEGGYRSIYPDKDFDIALIDIHFKYEMVPACEKFLQDVQEVVKGCGVEIVGRVS